MLRDGVEAAAVPAEAALVGEGLSDVVDDDLLWVSANGLMRRPENVWIAGSEALVSTGRC